VFARDAPSQRKIGEVGAPDQQHQPRRRHQHDQDRSILGPDDGIGVTFDDDAPTLVRRRKVPLDAFSDRVHRGLCLLERHTVFQSGKRGQPVEVARHVGRLEGERPPDLDGRPVKRAALRQDANDCIRLLVELDRPIDDRGVGAELRHPEHMTEHHHLVPAELVFAGEKRAAEGCLDAEDLEIVGRDTPTSKLYWLGAAGKRHRPARLGGHEVEDGVVLLPVEEIQRRDAVALSPRGLLEHPDDPIGVRIGERFQQDAIDETEDGRVGADPNRQRQDGHSAESRAVAQRPCGILQILEEQ